MESGGVGSGSWKELKVEERGDETKRLGGSGAVAGQINYEVTRKLNDATKSFGLNKTWTLSWFF